MKLLILILFPILLLASCATYSFIPIESENITLSRNRGTIIPIYVDDQLGISIVPKIIKSYLSLQVIVRNNSISLLSQR